MTKSTYWNNAGKFNEAAEELQKLIPAQGSIEGKQNKALEKFRKAVNVYYDFYNNGLYNQRRAFKGVFGFSPSYLHMDTIAEQMEVAMDKIIQIAYIEQMELVNSQK